MNLYQYPHDIKLFNDVIMSYQFELKTKKNIILYNFFSLQQTKSSRDA